MPAERTVTTARQLAPYRAVDVFGRTDAPSVFGTEWDQWLSYSWNYWFSRYAHHRVRGAIALSDIVRICPATQGYLYSKHTPTRARYTVGARPVLEDMLTHSIFFVPTLGANGRRRTPLTFAGVRRHVRARNSDQEIAIAIADWTYWELYRRGQVLRIAAPGSQVVVGCDEEDVLHFRGRTESWDCSRVCAALMQLMGVASRLAFIFGKRSHAGRVGVEAHIGGRWAFFDVAAGCSYLDRRGRIARLGDVGRDPECMRRPTSKPDRRATPHTGIAIAHVAVANYRVRTDRD